MNWLKVMVSRLRVLIGRSSQTFDTTVRSELMWIALECSNVSIRVSRTGSHRFFRDGIRGSVWIEADADGYVITPTGQARTAVEPYARLACKELEITATYSVFRTDDLNEVRYCINALSRMKPSHQQDNQLRNALQRTLQEKD